MRILTAALLLFVVADRVPAQALTAEQPLGCWRFAFTPWVPDVALGDRHYYPLPVVLELSDALAYGGHRVARRLESHPETYGGDLPREQLEDMRRLTRDSLWLPPPAPSRSLPAYWRATGANSLSIVLPTAPMTGIRVRVVQRGDSLAGVAEIARDVAGAPVPQSSVMATRVSCPAT